MCRILVSGPQSKCWREYSHPGPKRESERTRVQVVHLVIRCLVWEKSHQDLWWYKCDTVPSNEHVPHWLNVECCCVHSCLPFTVQPQLLCEFHAWGNVWWRFKLKMSNKQETLWFRVKRTFLTQIIFWKMTHHTERISTSQLPLLTFLGVCILRLLPKCAASSTNREGEQKSESVCEWFLSVSGRQFFCSCHLQSPMRTWQPQATRVERVGGGGGGGHCRQSFITVTPWHC